MWMMVFAGRLSVALKYIKLALADVEQANKVSSLERKIYIESQAVLYKLTRLIEKYNKSEIEVCNLENTKEFLELVHKHFNITVATDAVYFSRHDSLANLICSTIAVELSTQTALPAYKEPWQILIPTLENTQNDVTQNHLSPLKSRVIKTHVEKQNDQALKPWEVIVSSDGKRFIEIFTCLNTFSKNGFVHTSDLTREAPLNAEEQNLVINHSSVTKQFYEEFNKRQEQHDGKGMVELKSNFKQQLRDEKYKVSNIYGQAGEDRLKNNLLNEKNYFFAKDGQLNPDLIFNFFVSLPEDYWYEIKTLFNFTAGEISQSRDQLVNYLQKLNDAKLNWRQFLQLFITDQDQRDETIKAFLVKHIDPKEWHKSLDFFGIKLSDFCQNYSEMFKDIPRQYWQSFAVTLSIAKHHLFKNFNGFITFITQFPDNGDRKFFVEFFKVEPGSLFTSREQLIKGLISRLNILPISQWQAMFNLLGINKEALFSNRDELIDLLVKHRLPITEWKTFLKEFPFDLDTLFGSPREQFAVKHLAKGDWQTFLTEFDLKKEKMFENKEQLFTFMEEQEQVDRNNWQLLLADFDENKLAQFILNEAPSKLALKTAKTKLGVTREDTLRNRVMEFCLYQTYGNLREDEGTYTHLMSNIFGMIWDIPAKDIRQVQVALMLEFLMSGFMRTDDGFDAFLKIKKNKTEPEITQTKASFFDSYVVTGKSTFCTLAEDTLGRNVKPESIVSGGLNIFARQSVAPPAGGTPTPPVPPPAGAKLG